MSYRTARVWTFGVLTRQKKLREGFQTTREVLSLSLKYGERDHALHLHE